MHPSQQRSQSRIIRFDEQVVAAATIDDLKRRGHDVEMWPALTRRACSVEAILLDSKTGFLRAGADFRQPAYAMVS